MDSLGHIERMRRIACLAALGASVALAPSPAFADFEDPVVLSDAFGGAGDHELAFIPSSGVAHLFAVVWHFFGSDDEVQATTVDEDGQPGTIQTLSSTPGKEVANPQVVVNLDGDSRFAWESECGASGLCIKTRGMSAEGELGATQNISGPSSRCTEARVGRGADDSTLFAYGCDLAFEDEELSPFGEPLPPNHQIRARIRSATGGLGATRNISAANSNATHLRLVVDAEGNALFVWLNFDGTVYRVKARALSATGGLGPIQNITPAATDPDFPHVAMTPGGRAVFVWQSYDVTFTESLIQTRTRAPSGSLGAVVTLTAPDTYAVEPKVALDADGDKLFIWELQDSSNAASRVQARHVSAGGALSATKNISAANGHAFQSRVARNADGNAVIIWTVADGAIHRVKARTRADGGALGPIQTLSSAPFDSNFPNPQIALADDGSALAVFGRFNGTVDRIWAAAGP